MTRLFRIRLDPTKREAVMITEDDGVIVIEPMRFLLPVEAWAIARRGRAG